LKNTRAQPHTAEIIAPISYSSVETHRDEPWRRRSAEYESSKNRVTRALLGLVERHHSGFGDLVEYSELATPLTFEHFTSAPSGTIYGFPATPKRYGKAWLDPRTAIQNLYLTGSDAALLGIMGALMGGVLTASLLLGAFGFLEIMRAARSRS
jgi:all-trans-retinol 13,14-reductase